MPGEPSRPVNVLFVCIGNSCRSQMAEALANHLGRGKVRASSAGSRPLGYILPHTAEVLAEKGISLDGQWSKGIGEVPVDDMDYVVSMGCEVSCPVPLGFKGRVVEWSVPDPYSHDLEFFRSVRGLIEENVKSLLASLALGEEEGRSTEPRKSGSKQE
jgi:arsenate reductase (thioredoxin)